MANDIPRVPYEQMRDFIRNGEFDIVPDQTHQIGLEFGGLDTILVTLINRKWSFFVAAEGSGDFVTSDHPVCLVNLSGRPPHPLYPPGHGMKETAVLFPLGRRIMLCGRFEGGEYVRDFDRLGVAHFNAEVIGNAERQVYAYDDSFSYLNGEEVVQGVKLASDPLFARNYNEGE
jgi:hypothetical protein